MITIIVFLICSFAELRETVQNQILQLLSDSQCSGNISVHYDFQCCAYYCLQYLLKCSFKHVCAVLILALFNYKEK